MNLDLEDALADLVCPAPPTLGVRVHTAIEAIERFVSMPTPFGTLWVAFGPSGVSLVTRAPDEAAFRAAFAAHWGEPYRPLVPAQAAPPDLLAVIEGRRPASDLRYDLSRCSVFQRAVLSKASEIPRGQVRSYGWVAREIGQPAAVRAVGTALGRNPVPVLIPCHRVVRSDGHTGNYAFGPALKVRLLAEEGVDVEELHRLATAGVRYVGSVISRVFCVPTCHAAAGTRSVNRVAFRSAGEARLAGYRPCRQCRPAAQESTG